MQQPNESHRQAWNAPEGQFDPWSHRGQHDHRDGMGLGSSGALQQRWDNYEHNFPMVTGDHGASGHGCYVGHSPYTGLPSDGGEAPYRPNNYGSGNSVFLAGGQGNHDQFT
jgi:hypothetical protein